MIGTGFGKTFNADMRARFPKFPSSRDFTVGPELRVEIKDATAWEEPPMLDMPSGTNTVLCGFARKGATIPAFDLWISFQRYFDIDAYNAPGVTGGKGPA